MSVSIRPMRPDDLPAVASLRYQMTQEVDGDAGLSFDDYLAGFRDWVRRNEDSHRCLVLLRGDTIIGTAWLAVTERVPHQLAPLRKAGDLQSFYVVPAERNAGLGGMLIDAILALAAQLGLERVTVHSSERAVTAYRRHGFVVSPQLLQAEPGRDPL